MYAHTHNKVGLLGFSLFLALFPKMRNPWRADPCFIRDAHPTAAIQVSWSPLQTLQSSFSRHRRHTHLAWGTTSPNPPASPPQDPYCSRGESQRQRSGEEWSEAFVPVSGLKAFHCLPMRSAFSTNASSRRMGISQQNIQSFVGMKARRCLVHTWGSSRNRLNMSHRRPVPLGKSPSSVHKLFP